MKGISMQLPGAKTPVSPKVVAGANWSGYATLILTLLNTITPDSLAFLGHLAPLAYGVVIGGAYAIGAYLKTDPAREAGLAALAAQPANPLAIPVPDVMPADPAPAAPAAPAAP